MVGYTSSDTLEVSLEPHLASLMLDSEQMRTGARLRSFVLVFLYLICCLYIALVLGQIIGQKIYLKWSVVMTIVAFLLCYLSSLISLLITLFLLWKFRQEVIVVTNHVS
jgi:hypothetical protein